MCEGADTIRAARAQDFNALNVARFWLGNRSMRTLLALVLVAATSAAAHAGTYIGLGVGTGPDLGDSLGHSYRMDGRSARLALGYRFGPLAVEGMYSGYGYQDANAPGTGLTDSRSLQLAGKYNFALADHFELFGRLGLLRTDLSPRDTGKTTTTGTGYTFSVGVEYRIDVALTGLGIYIDWTRNQATFDQSSVPYDQTASMWTAGLNFAL